MTTRRWLPVLLLGVPLLWPLALYGRARFRAEQHAARRGHPHRPRSLAAELRREGTIPTGTELDTDWRTAA